MKNNDGFTLIELLVTLVIVGVIMTFIISMMSSQYAIIRDVDAYLVMSSENKNISDRILNEFIRAETIEIDLDDGNGYLSIVDNSGDSDYFTTTGIDLEKIRILYPNPSNSAETIRVEFDRTDDSMNELSMKVYVNDALDETIILGDHLAPAIPAQITFYRRLSLTRRVVALVKVKINYLHDGITKQYDLFYHLRNLQYPTN